MHEKSQGNKGDMIFRRKTGREPQTVQLKSMAKQKDSRANLKTACISSPVSPEGRGSQSLHHRVS
jgi:hypothetical protein